MEITRPSPLWAGESSFRMIDVSEKAVTRRRAVARGTIRLARAAFSAIQDGTNPKGDVLALAEVAGILAAKKTSDLLPLCHPLPLQSVRFSFSLDEKACAVTVRCEAVTSAQTGVEMEAISGVNGALLGIYDLSKAIDPEITLGEIRLDFKEGGKTGIWRHPLALAEEGEAPPDDKIEEKTLDGVRASVVTISDRVSRGKSKDLSGPALVARLEAWGAKLTSVRVVPDEAREIQAAVRHAIHDEGARLILTTGGTGLSPRDVTADALLQIADREIPGVGECLRATGAREVPTAWLSRSLGVLIGPAWVIALPGKESAVREGLAALRPLLSHGLHVAAGGDHPR